MSLWLEEADADEYFCTRLGADEYWATGTPKLAALTTAQSCIEASGLYTIPDEVTDLMKQAVCEQALFLLREGSGIDRRASLQAQGVLSAGIVQETYGGVPGIVIAPMAAAMLKSIASVSGSSFDVVR